ncbi:MAG: M56 family metallopeptidase [Gemmatimonadota bacterium]
MMSRFLPDFPSALATVAMSVIFVKATALVALACLATWRLGRGAASMRYAVWAVAFAGMLLLPALALTLPTWRFQTPANSPVRSLGSAPQVSFASALPGPAASAPEARLQPGSAPLGLAPSTVADFETPFVTTRPALSLPMKMVIVLWLTGTAILLARLGIGLLMVRRAMTEAADPQSPEAQHVASLAMSMGISRQVQLGYSATLRVPVTIGVFRPVVLLPEMSRGWGRDRLHVVLLHELAHVRRLDYACQIMQQIVCAFYWLNPLIMLAARRSRVEQERACDDVVLRMGTRSREYAGHLVDIARGLSGQPTPGLALAMAHPSTLGTRVRAILNPSAKRGGVSRRALCVAAFSAAMIGIPVASLSLWGEGRDREQVREAVISLREGSPLERERAAWLLGQLRSDRGVLPLVDHLHDSEPTVRSVAAWALGSIGSGSAREPLIGALRDPSPHVREMAVLALGALGDPRAIPSLALMTRDPEASVRSVTTCALGFIGGEAAARVLAEMLANETDAHTRSMAAGNLGGVPSEAGLAALLTALHDSSAEIRRSATYSLGRLADVRAVEALGQALRTDDEVEVRQGIAMALGRFSVPAAAAALVPAVSDPDASVRVMAVAALGQVGDARGAPALIAALDDPTHQVRLTAVESLNKLSGSRH